LLRRSSISASEQAKTSDGTIEARSDWKSGLSAFEYLATSPERRELQAVAARPLQRHREARARSAPLPTTYTNTRDATGGNWGGN